MLFLLIAVQWLHVLGGIFWFGSSLTNQVVVIPAVKAQPIESQRGWWHSYSTRYGQAITAVGSVTIVMGVLRGLAGGVWPLLGTPYGVTWIASLLLGIGLAVVGARLVGPTAARLASSGAEGYLGLLARLTRLGRIELGLFLVLFSMMIAMRFGY